MVHSQDLRNNNYIQIRSKMMKKGSYISHCNGIIPDVFYRCQHAFRGCQVETTVKKLMERHEAGECPFRIVSPLLDRLANFVTQPEVSWKKVCSKESQYFEYLREKGIMKIYKNRPNEINQKFSFRDNMMMENGKHFSLLVSMIEKFGQVFLERLEMDEKGQFFHWIQYLGCPSETEKYYYIIQYKNKYGKGYLLDELFHGEVLPMNVKIENLSPEKCLKTTRKSLENFMLDHLGSFNYTIELKKSL